MQFAKFFLLDVLFGTYLAITLHRILLHEVILSAKPPATTVRAAILYLIFGIAYYIFGYLTGASLSYKLLRKQQLTNWQDKIAIHTAWIISILTLVTGWVLTKISPVDFFSITGLKAAGKLFSALADPEFSIIDKAVFSMIETIYLALMATIIALPFSFALSFLSARNLMKHNNKTFAIYYIVRIFANFTRSIEPLIWAIIFSVWVGIGPFAGMLALMLHTVSSLVKQYSEQIEDIDQGPIEAIEAVGAHPLQVIWYAIVPQLLIPFLSFTIYRWDINVRMATIIGMVGGGGIGTLLMQYQGLGKWREVGLIVLLIAIVVWLMDYISAKIRENLQ